MIIKVDKIFRHCRPMWTILISWVNNCITMCSALSTLPGAARYLIYYTLHIFNHGSHERRRGLHLPSAFIVMKTAYVILSTILPTLSILWKLADDLIPCITMSPSMGLLPIRKITGWASAENAGNVFPATARLRPRHAPQHVRHICAVMQAGIAN